MCRHLAYLGPPVRLASLVLDPAHSLLHQSYAPQDMRSGALANADGFGVGWFSEGVPVRYRRACPLWTDPGIAELARSVSAPGVLAAVRAASRGMPVTEAAAAPFCDGEFLFSLNGFVRGWPHSVSEVARELSPVELMTLEAPTDSAFAWALLRSRLHAGADPATALADVLGTLERAAPGSRLNFLLTDGRTIYATVWTHALSILRSDESVLLSSEPTCADPRWAPLAGGTLVTATTTAVSEEELAVDYE
jgi:glutamine amidotransferase